MCSEHIISPIARLATSTAMDILKEHLNEQEHEMTVDQLVALGIFKSQDQLWPEVGSDSTDAATAFAEDFETLRYQGISSSKAWNIVQFIYAPRAYLIDGDYLSEDFVRDLDDETIEHIVDNALLNLLETKGLTPGENFNYIVSGVEDIDLSD